MRKYGLVGYPLSHSFSRQYFSEKFAREQTTDAVYENIPLEDIRELPEVIRVESKLRGLNVTIPYKEKVLAFMDELDGVARAVRAVNTIRIFRGHHIRLIGYNTDVWGFETTLKPLLKPWHDFALVLGTGGAAKAVEYVLKKLGMEVWFVSRKPKGDRAIRYNELTGMMLQKIKLIVNTTPLGMFPDTNTFPDLPYQYLTKEHLLYDLVYNPQETLFMKRGRERHATVINGLEMLRKQAEKSWEIWNRADKPA